MKTKIGCVLILLLTTIWILTNISLATKEATIYLESNKEIVQVGDEIEITVNLKDNTTSSFELIFYYDNEKWDYVSNIDNTNVKNNRILYVWYDVTGGKSAKSGEIVKFKFKAKAKGISTFNVTGEFYSDVGQLMKTNFEEIQVQIGKENINLQRQNEEGTSNQTNNAYLQVLRLDVAGLTPSFNKDIYEYYLTVQNNISNVDVLAFAENQNSIVDITGNTGLKEGLNTVKIKVTSEDKKNTKTYTIRCD